MCCFPLVRVVLYTVFMVFPLPKPWSKPWPKIWSKTWSKIWPKIRGGPLITGGAGYQHKLAENSGNLGFLVLNENEVTNIFGQYSGNQNYGNPGPPLTFRPSLEFKSAVCHSLLGHCLVFINFKRGQGSFKRRSLTWSTAWSTNPTQSGH